ncbi:MAG: hypothetical protein AAFV53_18445 [Myxococcota bacterium]
MNVLLWMIGAAWAQDEFSPIERTLPANAPQLSIRSGKADVVVRRDPGLRTSMVTVTPNRWYEGCSVAFSGDSTIAIAEVLEEGEPSAWRCTATFDVVLAGDTAVDVRLTKGDVSVESLSAPLTIEMKRGRVVGSPAQADIQLGRGRVNLDDLTTPVNVNIGVGWINLAYATSIAGTVTADVGWGRVTTHFPYGILLDDATETKVGWVNSEIPWREGEPTILQASAGLGSVQVRTDLGVLSQGLAEAN